MAPKRRRTEIAAIEHSASRFVTYSKRRKGLFNKASELSTFCGIRVAVVVFSPAGKPIKFLSHPSNDILSEYLAVASPSSVDWIERESDTMEDIDSVIEVAKKRLAVLESDHSGDLPLAANDLQGRPLRSSVNQWT